MENKMFCFQCQETARCQGCTQVGVCGKKPEVAAMQDLLIYATKGLSAVTTQLRAEGGKVTKDVNHLVSVNLFATITNANFDRAALIARVEKTLAVKDELKGQLKDASKLPAAALWTADASSFDAKAASDDVGVKPETGVSAECFAGYLDDNSIICSHVFSSRADVRSQPLLQKRAKVNLPFSIIYRIT